jgi:hypothetical protein
MLLDEGILLDGSESAVLSPRGCGGRPAVLATRAHGSRLVSSELPVKLATFVL